MRWAILSDIHANLEALDAVLADLAKERIARYICLGDIVGYGADPGACIARIKKLNPITIAGNHDWASVGLFAVESFNPLAKEAVEWTSRNLSCADKEFLQNLALVYQGNELTLVHGSLSNPGQFEYILDIYSAQDEFALVKTKLCFIGHSHLPVIFIKEGQNYFSTYETKIDIKAGQTYIINAGSIGQPRDSDPRAAYVLYDSRQAKLQIKRVEYDIAAAQDKIIRAGLPPRLAERLAWGR